MQPTFLSRLTLGAILLGSVVALPAQQTKPRQQMSLEEILPFPTVYRVAGMEEAEVRKNLVYKKVEARALKADVYLPPRLGEDERRPAVIFLSGGVDQRFEPRPKDWGFYVSYGQLAAANGLVGVTFDHRLSYPRRQYEEGASDLLDLLAYLRQHADSLHIDPERFGVVVYSGGGPMLSVVLREQLPYVRCLAAMYAFLSTEHVNPEEAETTPEVVAAHSPVRYVEAGAAVPPLFIARAGRDEIPGVNESIAHFLRVALEKNLNVEWMNHPTGRHAFDWFNDNERSRQIIRRLLDFLKENLADETTSTR